MSLQPSQVVSLPLAVIILRHSHALFSIFSLYTKTDANVFPGNGFKQVFEQQEHRVWKQNSMVKGRQDSLTEFQT